MRLNSSANDMQKFGPNWGWGGEEGTLSLSKKNAFVLTSGNPGMPLRPSVGNLFRIADRFRPGIILRTGPQ